MVTTTETPWVSRFTGLLNRDEIRKRVELRPKPILDIGNLSPPEASDRVEAALKRLFYPSAECLDFLHQWAWIAWAHSREMYRTPRSFVEGVYQQQSPLQEFYFPWCLTGLAGVGKSALLNALERLMPEPKTVTTADGTVFPLVSYRAITVRASSTPRDILTQFAQREGGVRVLTNLLRRLAYRDGWALVLQDEFQFATQSSQASTRVAQMILAMCYIGVPAVYIANFSLLHKLNSRNQEDRHRLLGRVEELHPDAYDSEDWRTLLAWQREIASDVFTYDPDGDAEAIHSLTAGVKRNLMMLLNTGFKIAFANDRVLDYSVLEKAYKSRAYATFRDDVEALAKLYGSFRNSRKDLWCPIIAVTSPNEDLYWKGQRQMRTDIEALKASLTVDERKAWARLSKESAVPAAEQTKTKVASIRRKKADAAQLQENNSWLTDKL